MMFDLLQFQVINFHSLGQDCVQLEYNHITATMQLNEALRFLADYKIIFDI